MPTQVPEIWPNSAEKENTCDLHPLAVGCIALLGFLHIAGSLILQDSLENVTAALNDDTPSCTQQFQRPASAVPYD